LGRISADHQQVFAGGKGLVAGAGRKHDDVAGLEVHRLALRTAELHAGISARYTEHFMDAGMVVHVVVDAVSPGAAPSVLFEKRFKDSGGIGSPAKNEDVPVAKERQRCIVRYQPVVLECRRPCLALGNPRRSLPGGRLADAGEPLERSFGGLLDVHCSRRFAVQSHITFKRQSFSRHQLPAFGTANFSSGFTAGPLRTDPSGAKCDPWHGQSQHCSVEFQCTWQPTCVQTGEHAESFPAISR
jgi:hypothetical protein